MNILLTILFICCCIVLLPLAFGLLIAIFCVFIELMKILLVSLFYFFACIFIIAIGIIIGIIYIFVGIFVGIFEAITGKK